MSHVQKERELSTPSADLEPVIEEFIPPSLRRSFPSGVSTDVRGLMP